MNTNQMAQMSKEVRGKMQLILPCTYHSRNVTGSSNAAIMNLPPTVSAVQEVTGK